MRICVQWMMLFIMLFFLSFSSANARNYGQILCKYPGFHCLKVKRNQSWYSLFQNAHHRDIVMRINRTNTQVWAGSIIAVPDDLDNVDILDFSPFPKTVQAPGERVIVVDPANQAWGAYDTDGTLVRWGPLSAGAEFCRDIRKTCYTHPGTFRIFSLGSSDCYSTKFPLPYGGAPMPYCMYFNNGQALHGEPNGLPGYNASHGCVRLYVNDAEWLRYDFVEPPNPYNEYRGTKVIVKEYSLASLERIKRAEDEAAQDEDDSDRPIYHHRKSYRDEYEDYGDDYN